MTSNVILCSSCTDVIYIEVGSDAVLQRGVHKSHHHNLASLLSAVEYTCFICCKAWWNIKYKVPKIDARASMQDGSTTCRISPENNDQILRLVILFQTLASPSKVIETKFRLLPCNKPKFQQSFPPLKLEPNTSSPDTLDLAFKWYQLCCNSHNRCKQVNIQRKGWLPRRLLDIGQGRNSQWKLVVTSKDGISQSSYMTLSYRWGSNQSLMLLKSTYRTFREGQPIISLPNTFKEAIIVAQRFGIRFLWIDALCIIQDSRDDWEREVPLMQYVYGNSACNIAASASDGPSGGLFRIRNTTTILPGIIAAPSNAKIDQKYYIYDRNYWNRQIFDGPLHRRGWVFQERLLAPRVLYFGSSQILWECFNDQKCEAFPQGIPGHLSNKNLDSLFDYLQDQKLQKQNDGNMPLNILRLWNDLVKDYSGCELTRISDKLPAFSGLAKLFGTVTGDIYLAGLWKSRILEQLTWRVHQPCTRESSGYRGPTWSWVSVDGPVQPRSQAAEADFLVSISNITLHRGELGVESEAVHVDLKLLGCLTASTKLNWSMHTILYPDSQEINLGKVSPFYFFPLQTSRQADNFDDKDSMYSIEVSCLLLEAVLCTIPVVFRRIGYCVILHEEEFIKLGLNINQDGVVRLEDEKRIQDIVLI